MNALLHMLPLSKRSDVHMYRSFDPDLPDPQPGYESEIDLVDPGYGSRGTDIKTSFASIIWKSRSTVRIHILLSSTELPCLMAPILYGAHEQTTSPALSR